MNRILFVSEESEAVRWRDALRDIAGHWQMRFVSSDAEAHAALPATSFDVVVADMEDPQAEDFALLAQIKATYPDAARIILSHPWDRSAVMRGLSLSHQFIAKPCEAVQLWKVVERTCALNGLVRNPEIRRVLGGLDHLPSVPRSYVALTQAVARDDVSLREIVSIVEKDAAMSAKVLQIVNSAYFGRAHRVASLTVTVSLLGLERLRALALSTHIFGMVGESESHAYGLQQLQERSLLTAQLARRFLMSEGRGDEGFTAGLLRNVGKLVFAICLKERYREVVELARRLGTPIQVIERERFQVSHAEVGACLLSLWGLPVTIVEAIAFHQSPSSVLHDDTALVDALHVADLWADRILEEGDPVSEELMLDPILMTRDGMDAKIQLWRAIASEEHPGMPA